MQLASWDVELAQRGDMELEHGAESNDARVAEVWPWTGQLHGPVARSTPTVSNIDYIELKSCQGTLQVQVSLP